MQSLRSRGYRNVEIELGLAIDRERSIRGHGEHAYEKLIQWYKNGQDILLYRFSLLMFSLWYNKLLTPSQ